MAGNDRLAQLRAQQAYSIGDSRDTRHVNSSHHVSTSGSSASPNDLSQQFSRYQPIQQALEHIQININQLNQLKQKNVTIANERQRVDLMRQVDQLLSATSQASKRTKQSLEQIKQENAAYARSQPPSSALVQARNNQFQVHTHRFQQLIQQYNNAASGLKQDMQNRTRRELRIVDSSLSENQVESIVNSGQASRIINVALTADSSAELRNTVAAIESRHLDIVRLEQQVREIFELFRDLDVLIDIQQESLNSIEANIVSGGNYVGSGERQLKEAETWQNKVRKRKFLLCIIFLVVLAVIIGLAVGLNH